MSSHHRFSKPPIYPPHSHLRGSSTEEFSLLLAWQPFGRLGVLFNDFDTCGTSPVVVTRLEWPRFSLIWTTLVMNLQCIAEDATRLQTITVLWFINWFFCCLFFFFKFHIIFNHSVVSFSVEAGHPALFAYSRPLIRSIALIYLIIFDFMTFHIYLSTLWKSNWTRKLEHDIPKSFYISLMSHDD